MQTRLEKLKPKKATGKPTNRIDSKGVQWIELNRGCKRDCEFCHADTDFKEFPIPAISSKKVQVIGEGFLYDSRIPDLLYEVGKRGRSFGLSQGIDFRLLTPEIARALRNNRFGVINNKGNWYAGLRFGWDWRMEHNVEVKKTIELLESVGYQRRYIIVFILVNWKVPREVCEQKLALLREWGVKVDDCTWECTKTNFVPLHWTERDYREFRRKCRQHNIDIIRGIQ